MPPPPQLSTELIQKSNRANLRRGCAFMASSVCIATNAREPRQTDTALSFECDLGGVGFGPEVNVCRYDGEDLQLTLSITRVVERGSLEVSIWGSEDGLDWGRQPLARFPRMFYCGDYRVRVCLTDYPTVRYLRARWHGERWGGGGARALFTARIQMDPADVGK